MKAVVLDLKKNKAVALSDDGIIKEVNNKNFRIGQTIEMERKSMKKMSKKHRNIAVGIAASLVILLGGGTAYAYNTPVAHVSLDVNPSITYSINAFNKVIAEESNLDAVDLLQTIEWNGKNIDEVVENTILALKKENYLENDTWYEDSIIIGVNATSTAKEEKLIRAIKNKLATMVAEETDTDTATETDIDTAKFDDIVIGIGAERVAEAIRLSEHFEFAITPGKLNLVEKFYASEFGDQESTSSEAAVWFESTEAKELFEGSVKEIMTQIKANRFEQKGMTPKGIDVELPDNASENASDMKVNGNNINNGDDKGNVNANVNVNANENAIERNANANQNSISHGAIETENEND